MAEGCCPGLELATKVDSLPDLLLRSPGNWLQQPLLRRRLPDGSWQQLNRITVQQRVLRLAAWLEAEGVKPGDRVGILGHNCVEWFIADFAILRLGAVTVPAYFTDPAEAVQFVFNDAGCRLAFTEAGEQLEKLTGGSQRVVPFTGSEPSVDSISRDEQWDAGPETTVPGRDALATLIYTSGTTGDPKGVMLTHGNLLSDVAAGLGGVPVWDDDLFLSFLPVSHAFERTVGHFLPTACGAEIAYAEDVTTLMRDMPEVQPTIMISVPRLYEKIYAGVYSKLQAGPAVKRWLFGKAQQLGMERFELIQQGGDLAGFRAKAWRLLDGAVNAKLREKMGGRLRLFISGGAALSPDIARFLLAAGITVLPGYGLTESAPVLCVNREGSIRPETVGPALPGVELDIADDGELLARGPMIMQGYWNRPEDSAAAIDADGWLHTGDLAEEDGDGFIAIVGRKKELIVLSNGENVPPAVIEQHLTRNPAILQAMVVGEKQPYVAALIVPDWQVVAAAMNRALENGHPGSWKDEQQVYHWMRMQIRAVTKTLPSFMQIENFRMFDEEWTQENGLLTPTLKLKRRRITSLHEEDIKELYSG